MIVLERPRERSLLRVWLPLAIFGALVCCRMPEIIMRGRFWAEEGSQFFVSAWTMPPAKALFTSYGGYLNLIANGAALEARWLLPLPVAPYMTIAIGLLFQLCPPLLVLTAGDAWLRPPHIRFVALLFLLLVPCSEEVWLQTLHCQFELLLCCAMILALETATGWRSGLRLVLLALAPLSGVVVIALVPLFVLRAAIDRSNARLLQTLALAAPASVQMIFFFHAIPGRDLALHPVLLLCAFTIRDLALPFLGADAANRIGTSIRASLTVSHIPILAVILPPALGILLLVAIVRARATTAFWLLSAGALIAVVSYAGALGGVASLLFDVGGQARYVVVPHSLFCLSLLAFSTAANDWMKYAAWAVVVWLLCLGAWMFATPSRIVGHGPNWQNEVALWRNDPHHVIRLWPDGWTMTLDDGHRAR